MAQTAGEDVYATLLLNDTYLPGALVLAHSLRDAGTTKPLAVLVTPDTVSVEVVTELKRVYDHVLSTPRIQNRVSPANLRLMNRPDLHSALTKIYLWNQTQFRKIVYLDADVVAYRAPDELFDLAAPLAAAPDIGWPDLFNTGVMVLTPSGDEFSVLADLAERGVSFDGADQGLLNMHFGDLYHRLPFTYNVTPSAHYQYLPAYRHFQASISMVHFIGSDKPWSQGRSGIPADDGPYADMVRHWWATYDRHYSIAGEAASAAPELVQYFVKGEYEPTVTYTLTSVGPSVLDVRSLTHGPHSLLPPSAPPSFFAYHKHQHQHLPALHHDAPSYEHSGGQDQPSWPQNQPHALTGQHSEQGPFDHVPQPATLPPYHPPPPHSDLSLGPLAAPASFAVSDPRTHTETRPDQVPGPQPTTAHPPESEQSRPPYQPPNEPSWDAQWQPPPTNAKPEALNFPQAHYEMSHDTTPFVPPERYPSPPRDMWYQVPSETPAPAYQRPEPIFPWEAHQPAPSRVFTESAQAAPESQTTKPMGPSGSNAAYRSFGEAGTEPSFAVDATSVDLQTEPATPTMSSTVGDPRQPPLPPSDPWASFTRTNAWDDVPQIERYVDAFQKQHRRVRSRGQAPAPPHPGGLDLGGSAAGPAGTAVGSWHSDRGGLEDTDDDGIAQAFRRASRITDFPSEVERPSLPVTPAPIRRPMFWGGGGLSFGSSEDGAESGENQLPAAKGVPQQADWDPVIQLQKLAKEQPELLLQKLGIRSGGGEPSGGSGGDDGAEIGTKPIPLRPVPQGLEGSRSSTYVAQAPTMSPKPVKAAGVETSSVRDLYGVNSRGRGNDGDDEPLKLSFLSTDMDEPSYKGPGLMFEKDEAEPEHGQTAGLASEEEKDVLET